MNKTRQRPLHLKRTALTLIGFMAMAFVSMAISKTASAVSLKPASVITDSSIKLGDLFDGLDNKADRVLGPAPRPGQDMTLNARTLMRIAKALDLDWRPVSSADTIVLTRAATVIERNQVEDSIKNALHGEGLNGDFNVIIPNEMAEMILPYETPNSVEVVSLNYLPNTDRFEAMLAAPSKENAVRQMRVSGSVERLVKVPVPRTTLQAGDLIGIRDIDFIDMPEERVNHDLVMKAEDLVGMTPRRILMSGKTVKLNEIEAPRIVDRGENVTMVFTANGMTLTAQGKALEFGAMGDYIRVTNTSSNETVQGLVTGAREITVQNF